MADRKPFCTLALSPVRATMRQFSACALPDVSRTCPGGVMVKQIARCVLMPFVLTLAVSAAAHAQPWEDKMYVNANLGFDLTSRSFTESLAPVIYDERGAITTTHNIDSGFTPIDVEGGVRIWRSVGIGGGFTRRAQTETATVDARGPHPTLFGQPRFTSLPMPLQHTPPALHP